MGDTVERPVVTCSRRQVGAATGGHGGRLARRQVVAAAGGRGGRGVQPQSSKIPFRRKAVTAIFLYRYVLLFCSYQIQCDDEDCSSRKLSPHVTLG